MVNYSSNALCWIIFANICIFSSNILFRTHALLFINKTDLYFQWGFQVVLVVKNLLANAGNSREVRWIPGMGRSPGEANDNPPQCSCQGNPMARGVWRATVLGIAKNWTWFSVHVRARTHTHTHTHTHKHSIFIKHSYQGSTHFIIIIWKFPGFSFFLFVPETVQIILKLLIP